MRGLLVYVRDKIFRDVKYELLNVITYKYNKIYEVTVKAYFLKEKRYRYNNANDLNYIKVIQEHLSNVIKSLLLRKGHEYVLPIPPIAQV
jgi:hypothetical protein